MIYLLYGSQPLKIKNRIKKIEKDFFESPDIEYSSVVDMDLTNESIFNVIDEVNQFSLTSNKKVVNVKNATIFETQLKTKFKKSEIEEIITCFKNLREDVCLIFSLCASKVSTTNEIYKLISTDGKILEFKEIKKEEWPLVVNDYFIKRGIKLDNETIDEIVARTNMDVDTFINEAEKLILYKGSNITLKDVKELVPDTLETDSFKILNSLLAGDKSNALKIYKDLRLKNMEVITLISLISSSLIFALNVKNLQSEGRGNDEIAKITQSSPGRIFMTNKNFKNYTVDFLLSAIKSLQELDRKIKHSEIDRFYGFELFLLNF